MPKAKRSDLTVTQAAKRIGLNPSRVRALCAAGRIKATHVKSETGGAPRWSIDPKEVALFKKRNRRPGNPHKGKRLSG